MVRKIIVIVRKNKSFLIWTIWRDTVHIKSTISTECFCEMEKILFENK